jgi:hypothetical protein
MLGLSLAVASQCFAAAQPSESIVTVPPDVKQWLDQNKAEVIILDVNGKLKAVGRDGKEQKLEFKAGEQKATKPTTGASPAPALAPQKATASLWMICWGNPIKCYP